MTVEEFIRSLSPNEKLEAFQILHRELSAEEQPLVAPKWHEEVLAARRANPDPAPALPVEEAFEEIWAEYHATKD